LAEREISREKDRQASALNHYEAVMSLLEEKRERATSGRIVIRRSTLDWQQNRQGKVGYYMVEAISDTALTDWRVFAHEIHTHSGKHTHQGGIVLYVTKGRGYTVVNGVKKEWKAGDMVLLPVLPGGVEHQHWSLDPDTPSEWVAFRYIPWMSATGSQFTQRETSPNWQQP